MSKKVSDIIVEIFQKEGVKVIFGILGIKNLPLFYSLQKFKFPIITPNFDFSLPFMADGYVRLNKDIGVCISVEGPGITSLITGIAEALADSSPLLIIVPSLDKKSIKNSPLHEIDQPSLIKVISKEFIQIEKKEEIYDKFAWGFYCARKGEPGPVIIEISSSIFEERLKLKEYIPILEKVNIDMKKIDQVIDILKNSRGVLLFTGKGALFAHKEVEELTEILKCPVLTTISGRGIIPETHPLHLGLGFNSQLSKSLKKIEKNIDTVLCIGCKFSELSTLRWTIKFPSNLIYIDKTIRKFNSKYQPKIYLQGDAKEILRCVISRLRNISFQNKNFNLNNLNSKRYFTPNKLSSSEGIRPEIFFRKLREYAEPESILITDCGAHQLWAISEYCVYKPFTFLSPTNFQSTGFAIPASIGAKLAQPLKEVLCICGNSGFLGTGLEILTALKEKLHIKIFLFNDKSLGIIRVFQNILYNISYKTEILNPDFSKFSQSLGIRYFLLNREDQLDEKLKEIFSIKNSIVFTEVRVSYNKIPPYLKEMLIRDFLSKSFKEKYTTLYKKGLSYFHK